MVSTSRQFAARPPLRPAGVDRFDRLITAWLAAHSISLLRIAVGLLFVWFGVLKFISGASPAEDLATRTIETLSFGMVGAAVSLPLLATWEVLIGVGLMTGWFLRATLALLALQMVGALTPLLLFPEETFTIPFVAPSLEGQYIIKNLVIITAAMVIGATVRGGRLDAEPDAEPDAGEPVSAQWLSRRGSRHA